MIMFREREKIIMITIALQVVMDLDQITIKSIIMIREREEQILIMIALQVVMDLDLMYSGNGSLVFSLQSMRCEIKKVTLIIMVMVLVISMVVIMMVG